MVSIAIAGIALAFIVVDVAIQFIQHRRGKVVYGFFIPDPPEAHSAQPANYGRMLECLRGFGIAPAQNVFVHAGHTWAAIEESGQAAIGMDAFARNAIGRINEVTLPRVGQKVRQGERLFSVRQGGRIAEFVSPINGTVTALNESPKSQSAGSAWLCKVNPSNLAKDVKALRIAENAVKWMYGELFRLHELVAGQIPRLETVGATMQDGAVALDNLLESLDDDAWKLFREQFLQNS
jgi:glycine cleavage system H protein